MGYEVLAGVRPLARAASQPDVTLLIAAPFYRNERLVPRFVEALAACDGELRQLGARVLLINDSPDYQPLADALQLAVSRLPAGFPIEVRANPENRGWLKTANSAMAEAKRSGADLLLMNSDTVIFPGAVSEMARVAALDPMIAFVNPRSNNATLANLPIGERFQAMAPAEAHAAFLAVSRTLPALTYTPTAVGFAMLIRRNILAEFGGFDEVYGGGYNEENDLVMRAGRCGYRAVTANHAFVWHEGEQSLGDSASSKALVEASNRAILDARYPEYGRLVEDWFNGVEHISEQLMSTLVPGADGRLKIAFDFSSFGPYHSGTQRAGVQLLQAAGRWSDRFEVFVLCEENTYAYHDMGATGAQRAAPHGPEKFAAIFRVGQPFEWDSVRRLSLKGATTGIFMLDTIALDCSHLHSPALANLWQFTLNTTDFIVYNSEFTQSQFHTRFSVPPTCREAVSLHTLDIDDYRPVASRPRDDAAGSEDNRISDAVRNLPDQFILVMGNHYPHKAVGMTANLIARAHPELHVVSLGITRERSSLSGAAPGEHADALDTRLSDLPNLTGFRVGNISTADMDELHRKARLIVMPSHYEGFGLPVPGALAIRKPILVRPLPPIVEIHRALGENPNVHFFETTDQLVAMLRSPPSWTDTPAPRHIPGDAQRAADDILALIEDAIASASYQRIAARFRAVHTVFGAFPIIGRAPPGDPPEAIARQLGRTTERVAHKLLKQSWFYGAARAAYRLLGPLKPRL